MSSRRIHVGQTSLNGGLARYARVFDLLEVRSDPAPPSLKHVRRLAAEAPVGFVFSLVASRKLAELAAGGPDEAEVATTSEAARALGARFLVIRTPASATPGARTSARLGRLVRALEGAAPSIAWEPRGIWTDEEVIATAEQLGVVPVRDLAEQEAPPGDLVYTRLLALGRNSRIGSGAIERLSERLEETTQAFVVVEGRGGVAVARALRGVTIDEEAAGEAGFEPEERDDDAVDEEDEDGDER